MQDYLLILRGGSDYMSKLSQEESQIHMQKWIEWMGSLAQNGFLKGGDPLAKEGNIVYKKSDGTIATDAPLPEVKELVGGYIMLSSDSLESATKHAINCPIFEHNGTVEVREITPMNM